MEIKWEFCNISLPPPPCEGAAAFQGTIVHTLETTSLRINCWSLIVDLRSNAY